MIELSVTGPLLAKSDGQIWQVRVRTNKGVEIRDGSFRQMAKLLMGNLNIEEEEMIHAVTLMLSNDHDVAFFNSLRRCAYSYSSKEQKRMDEK